MYRESFFVTDNFINSPMQLRTYQQKICMKKPMSRRANLMQRYVLTIKARSYRLQGRQGLNAISRTKYSQAMAGPYI